MQWWLTKARLRYKFVCADCFKDYAIRDFIRSKAIHSICTYCGRQDTKAISACMGIVIDFLLDGFCYDWVPNTPEHVWEAENFGWHGGPGWDSETESKYLVRSLLPDIYERKGEILENILSSMNALWRPRMQYDPEPEDFFSFRWDEFAKAVKYQTRYVYYRVNTGWQKDVERRQKDSRFRMRTHDTIEEVLDNISAVNNVRFISSETQIWRARIHDLAEYPNNAKELGAPPFSEALLSTRMSAAGIPVFYCALDRETALAETRKTERSSGISKVLTIGLWKPLKTLRVLDLAEIPPKPSVFDAKRRHLREVVSFLAAFSEDISHPIQKDGHEHIEYVPTQVFTEYIRYVYKDHEGAALDGILYRSAVNECGINCVLFLENEECCEYPTSTDTEADNPKPKVGLVSWERIDL